MQVSFHKTTKVMAVFRLHQLEEMIILAKKMLQSQYKKYRHNL